VKADAQPIRLMAEDARDLEVVSAMLQDALTSLAEMRFEPRKRRFVAMLNRYARERGEGVRVRSALKLESVLAVRTTGIDQTDRRGLLPLLALTAQPADEGVCHITLEFAGGGSIRLEAECVDAALSDVGPSWRTPRRPQHPVDP
jgi:hypothetical protein